MQRVGLPFEGVDGWIRWALLIGFVVVVVVFCWTIVLAILAERWTHSVHRRDREFERDGIPDGSREEDFFWVFLVPARDEELTIADSVERLRHVQATRRLIIVIDDASEDDTPRILERYAGAEDLVVVRRELPNARTGKSDALDDAWRRLPELLAARGVPREDVVTCVVDADGRLEVNAPARVALSMSDPEVGGVQVLVRIYNRRHLLTWMQDVEFRVMGLLFQSARSQLGTAGMGGNAQFNRLTALDQVVDDTGPWRDTLTEDQDLGLRLLAAKWKLVHDNGTHVEQQGVPGIVALYRQRTRWAQGNLQAMSLLPRVLRANDLGVGARAEQLLALLMPIWQLVVGSSFVLAIWMLLTDQVNFTGDGQFATVVFYYLLGFAGTIIGCVMQGWRLRGFPGLVAGLLLVHVYALYSWILWPVLVRAIWRQLVRRRAWAKTPRQAISERDKARADDVHERPQAG